MSGYAHEWKAAKVEGVRAALAHPADRLPRLWAGWRVVR
jgi:hypothetical protein